jgi:hypothetical protein
MPIAADLVDRDGLRSSLATHHGAVTRQDHGFSKETLLVTRGDCGTVSSPPLDVGVPMLAERALDPIAGDRPL